MNTPRGRGRPSKGSAAVAAGPRFHIPLEAERRLQGLANLMGPDAKGRRPGRPAVLEAACLALARQLGADPLLEPELAARVLDRDDRPGRCWSCQHDRPAAGMCTHPPSVEVDDWLGAAWVSPGEDRPGYVAPEAAWCPGWASR